MPPRVVHVAECWDAGVKQAASAYAAATPDCEHHLVAATRFGAAFEVGEQFLSVVKIVEGGGRFLPAAARHLRRMQSADVVHLHSSFAGALGFGLRSLAVWTPHTFAHQQQSLNRWVGHAYRCVDWGVARSVRAVGAASEHEFKIARDLGAKRVVTLTSVPVVELPPRRSAPDSQAVVQVGRVTAAKNPTAFAELAVRVGRLDPRIKFLWLGGGDPNLEQELRRADVAVSGWLERDDLHRRLRDARVVVSTSSWETGINQALLEAAKLGLPIQALDILPLADAPAWMKASSVDELAHWVLKLTKDDATWRVASERSVGLAESRSWEDLTSSLGKLYAPA